MARSTRQIRDHAVWIATDRGCKVVFGELVPKTGQKRNDNLFKYVGEKLPFHCLDEVREHLRKHCSAKNLDGVYMAHDSFGVPRYGGRGRVFRRLKQRWKKYPKELAYFSFYIVKNKGHERELENAILRAAGPQMSINKVKVRKDAKPGSVGDYEPGTLFYLRKDTRKPNHQRKQKSLPRALHRPAL